MSAFIYALNRERFCRAVFKNATNTAKKIVKINAFYCAVYITFEIYFIVFGPAFVNLRASAVLDSDFD